VANIGPADCNYDESVSTLRYANRAKNIKNKPKINEDPKDALLRQFQKEIEDLKRQLEEGVSDDDASDADSDSEEEVVDHCGLKQLVKKRRGRKHVSKEAMAEIEARIEEDRRLLESEKDMAEEERNKVRCDLERKQSELSKYQDEQEQLKQKLCVIEKKIIVGGENLLEKAEEQERLLQESARELEARKEKEEELKKALEEKEQERLDIEEKYSSLQEEVSGKTRKLKRVWTMLMQAKSEIADLQQEHQREMEGLLENVRQLSRDLKLQMAIIDSYIPPMFQAMIENHVHWNEDIGEWQLKCVAYTGNNMRKQMIQSEQETLEDAEVDLSHVYLSYTRTGELERFRHKTGRGIKAGRSKTASRPRSSKKKHKEPSIDALLQ
ncbi:unnamed protein product, partial [Candidula unifasciata]